MTLTLLTLREKLLTEPVREASQVCECVRGGWVKLGLRVYREDGR